MKYKLRFLFILISSLAPVLLTTVGTSAQGIGDRNRPAESGDGRYSIQGKIYLPDGKPAVNVKASITSADAPGTSAIADVDGVFQVSGLRAGNYRITLQPEGFAAESENLTIDRFAPIGSTLNVVFHLRALPQKGMPRAEVVAANPLLADVPDDAYSKFRKGADKLARNDPKGAIVHFDEAIAAYPKFAAAYHERGAAYLKVNDADKALESFVKAIEIKPDYIEAKYSVGYTQFIKKNYAVAAAVFDDVLKQKADWSEAQMYLGISLCYLRNNDAAEVFLKRSIMSGGGKTALSHRFLGGIYLQQDKSSEAAAELQKYLDLVPKAPDANRLKETIAKLKKKS